MAGYRASGDIAQKLAHGKRNRWTHLSTDRDEDMGLLSRLFGRDPHVAVLVDGPNVLREEFSIDLASVRDAIQAGSGSKLLRLYVDEHASPGLIRAAEANGFEVIVTSGDVDVRLAVDAARLAERGTIDVLAIASRDADFKPAFEAAADAGIRTVAISPGDHGNSAALRNAADEAIMLESG